jgi:hypothetical protein
VQPREAEERNEDVREHHPDQHDKAEIGQNRQDAKDRVRGELDYQVNRRSESEIQGLARKLNLVGDKLGDLEDLLREKLSDGQR